MKSPTICECYEADLDALREAEEIEAAGRECFGDDVWEAMQAEAGSMVEALGADPDPCSGCWGCKHLGSGAGYPGEYVYHCSCPGREHIISIEFNQVAVI